MIGIIAAMEKEMDAITSLLTNKEEYKVSGIAMVKGSIKGKNVIVMKSGVGKGNAAMATTILFENFVITAVINIGTAGGLKKDQQVLDAVLSTRVVQHDFDTSIIDGNDGLGLYYDADAKLIEACDQVLPSMGVRVFRGLVASGDQFIAEDEKRERIETLFPDAICAEMEAGAIAQVCSHYHVPFVVLRSLSDVAHKEDSQMDFLIYVEHAAKRSATLCQELMEFM